MKKKLTEHWAELVVALLLGLSSFTWAKATIYCVGIDLADEADLYLATAVRHQLNAPDWGPLYILWYRLLLHFEKDSLQLYFTSGIILVVLCVLAYFFLLRRLSFGLLQSYFCAFIFMMCPYLIFVVRRPNHLAFAILGFSFGLGLLFRRKMHSLIVFSVGLLLASYAHPEYYAGFVLSVVLLQIYAIRERRSWGWVDVGFLAFLFVFSAKMIRGLGGAPLNAKAIFVFFAKNAERLHGSAPDVENLYHHASSLGEALQANPGAFLANLAFYSQKMLFDLWAMLQSTFYLAHSPLPFVMAAVIGLTGLGAARGLWIVRRLSPQKTWEPRLRTALLAAGPPALACLAFGGLPQYMFTILGVTIAAISLPLRWVRPADVLVVFASLALLIWIWIAPPDLAENMKMAHHNRTVLDAILYLKTLPLRERLHILATHEGKIWSLLGEGASGSIWCYGPGDFCPTADTTMDQSFLWMLRDQHWNVLFVGNDILRDVAALPENRFKKEFQALVSNPHLFGFTSRRPPDCNYRIYIKETIL